MSVKNLLVRRLGLMDYEPVWRAMQAFTDQRDENTPDELWIVEHPPVFTQGQAGRAEHILAAGDIFNPVASLIPPGQFSCEVESKLAECHPWKPVIILMSIAMEHHFIHPLAELTIADGF